MVSTFILTRAFAISAVLASALPAAFAAPVAVASASDMAHSTPFDKRFCRQMGCLFEVPSETTDGSEPANEAADAEPQLVTTDGTGSEAVFVVDSGEQAVPQASVDLATHDLSEHANSD